MAFEFAIALTGGIATGKSTSSALFSLSGFKIIDADKIAHEILNKSIDEIKNMFGDEYIINNNIVDRKSLGKLIFSDCKAKKRLENFIHPKIFETIKTESEKLDIFKVPYLIDIPLFFERAGVYQIDKSILIYAPRENQLTRIISRDKISEIEANQRLNAQLPIDEKLNKATWIIKNIGSLKNLQNEIERVSNEIKEIFNVNK